MTSFVVGRLADDAEGLGRGGWILGSFFDATAEDGDRHTNEMEVKYWKYEVGDEKTHSEKVSATLEWSFILSGSVTARLDGKDTLLHAGDYVIIHPEVPNNLVQEVHQAVTAITVKAPSDPGAKRVI